ncbi:MAG: LysR family transcriptional regulator [Deltaproteobacteria bacterium]|nr:LysR family transcriptional regulator [Deltaproteobacteria bacterium]
MKKTPSPIRPPVDFDLRQLEIFQKVVELGSFSKAAESVCLAQASVSERIATLENTVGARLLDRMGRQVVPTRAGEILYKHALILLDMKRTACLEMDGFLGMKRGQVSLGGSTIPGEYILPRCIGEFCENYPDVTVTLSVGDTHEVEARVLAGELELGVIGSKSTAKNLIAHELWRDELVLAVPPDHRWAKKDRVSPEELLKEPFIMRETGSGTLKIMEDYLQKSKLGGIDRLNVVACFGSSTAVKEGVKAGLGVSILSSRALETEAKTGLLKALKVTGLSMVRSFYLIRDRRRIASPLCQALLDFLLSRPGNPSQ